MYMYVTISPSTVFFTAIHSKVYSSPDPPRVVLNKLSSIGYHVLTSCGAGQTCIWTLYKPPTETDTH